MHIHLENDILGDGKDNTKDKQMILGLENELKGLREAYAVYDARNRKNNSAGQDDGSNTSPLPQAGGSSSSGGGTGRTEAVNHEDIPWYLWVPHELSDNQEDFVNKFSNGNIAGGMLNLLGATLNSPKSAYLNLLNMALSGLNGETPHPVYNMNYRDYQEEQKRKFGGNTIYDYTDALKEKGIFGSLAGNTIDYASELLTDPMFLLSFYLPKLLNSENALMPTYGKNSYTANESAWMDDAANSAGNVLKPQELLDDLANSGVKCNLDDVVTVVKTPDGKLMWLENGSSSSGLQHILDEHTVDFSNRGVIDIPGFLNKTLQNIPVKTGMTKAGPYAEYIINGKMYKIGYGTNGYIVSFYPIK